jgi:hypothetical protein
LCANHREYVTYAELTFDLTGTPFEYFRKHVLTPARRQRELGDTFTGRTLYLGSPHSPWQVKVYEKTDQIIRVEYVFRLDFLRTQAIHQVDDLLKLRNLDLSRFAMFYDISQAALDQGIAKIKDEKCKKMLSEWPRRHRSLQVLAQTLSYHHIPRVGIFRESAVSAKLREMQRNLVW